MIFAVSPEGIIGKDGKIPWHHPGDLRRFKRVTQGKAVIMGRLTFESMGKPLPDRRNIVVTRRNLGIPGIECVPSIREALDRTGDTDVWFIGGAGIYEEALAHVDRVDVTYVPDHVDPEGAVRAPVIDPRIFEAQPLVVHEDEPTLVRRLYLRKKGGA
ncbi:MAG: dihydrofolate reductase [Polyangiaceae bacterium]